MRPIRPAARRPRAAVAAAAVLVAGGLAVTVASPASAATFTVDSGADAVDADPGDGTCETAAGECTLRAAVQQAQASGGPDTIVFADGVTSVTLTIAPAGEAADGSDDAATGDLDLDDVTIDGDGVSISNGDVADRLFHVEPGGTARLIGLELLGGTAPGAGSASGGGSGGAVLNAGSLTVENGRIADSTAVRAGGGIEASAGSETTVVGTLFEGNSTGTSPGNGGGIHITGGGTVTVEDSEFLANTAANEGGGVWNSAAATMTVIGSVFEGNVAAGAPAESGGGGLFNDGGTLVVEDSAVEGNSATGAAGSGGGVLNQGTLRMSGTAVVGNEAVRAGGGVESAPGGSGSTPTTETVTELDDVLLEGNTAGDAPGNGGGFHQTGAGTVSVTGSVVTGNSAAAEGGGLWNSAAATMTVRDTDVSDNVAEGTEASNGGGGIYTDGGRVDVVGGSITGNTAVEGSGSGGGVLNVGGEVTLTGTSVTGNRAARAGGGIEAAGGADGGDSATTLTGIVLAGNETGPMPGNGGGLHITGPGTVDVATSTVRDNTAANEGGGLWNSAAATMTVTATTLSGNTASGTDDGSGGGGLYNDGGTLRTLNTTVSGNDAAADGGGVLSVGGEVELRQTTVTENSAGVHGAMTLRASIVAGNQGADCTGEVSSAGGVVGGDGCPDDGAGDVGGVDDPQLGPLADNGGPTLTHLPQDSSPAIDVVAASECTSTDQRGATRPADGDGNGSALCDAGAVEAGTDAPAGGGGGGGRVAPASPARAVTAQPTFTG